MSLTSSVIWFWLPSLIISLISFALGYFTVFWNILEYSKPVSIQTLFCSCACSLSPLDSIMTCSVTVFRLLLKRHWVLYWWPGILGPTSSCFTLHTSICSKQYIYYHWNVPAYNLLFLTILKTPQWRICVDCVCFPALECWRACGQCSTYSFWLD